MKRIIEMDRIGLDWIVRVRVIVFAVVWVYITNEKSDSQRSETIRKQQQQNVTHKQIVCGVSERDSENTALEQRSHDHDKRKSNKTTSQPKLR